jgi:RecA/RadA recombinase
MRRQNKDCILLDILDGSVINFGVLSLIYGEASVGKTTTSLNIVFNYLERDPAVKAYYMDADGKLSTTRMLQIAGEGNEELLKRIMIWKPTSFAEQWSILKKIPLMLKESDLLLIDSVTGLYRLEARDREQNFKINKELNHHLAFLKEVAITKTIGVIITGQVRDVFEEREGIEPVAPRLLHYWSDLIIKLELTPYPQIRQALKEKPEPTQKCMVGLDQNGISGVENI